jgi:hypothetical protein
MHPLEGCPDGGGHLPSVREKEHSA